jgi:hypothetical protein
MSEQDTNTRRAEVSCFRPRAEVAVEKPVENHLKFDITMICLHAVALRDQAGRSEVGRQLAIVATELEKIKAFVGYYGL